MCQHVCCVCSRCARAHLHAACVHPCQIGISHLSSLLRRLCRRFLRCSCGASMLRAPVSSRASFVALGRAWHATHSMPAFNMDWCTCIHLHKLDCTQHISVLSATCGSHPATKCLPLWMQGPMQTLRCCDGTAMYCLRAERAWLAFVRAPANTRTCVTQCGTCQTCEDKHPPHTSASCAWSSCDLVHTQRSGMKPRTGGVFIDVVKASVAM